MSAKLTVIQFYNILYNICRNYPRFFVEENGKKNEIPCKRPNTFAVVYEVEQIQADNLDKSVRYKGKNLFYSRHWEESNNHPSEVQFYYPALLVAEADTIYKSAFEPGYGEYVTFNLMVYDKMPGKNVDISKEKYCSMRTFEEVGEDIHKIAKRILQELQNFHYIILTTSTNENFEGWFPLSWIESESAIGNIITYRDITGMESFLSSDPVRGSKIFSAFSDDLAGYFVNISVHITDCDETEIIYSDILSNSIKNVPDSFK